MATKTTIEASDVFLVIDVQNDFCPGGRLPAPRGDEVVLPINRLARRFEHVVLTQDWHPLGHSCFASSHPAREPFEMIETTLWSADPLARPLCPGDAGRQSARRFADPARRAHLAQRLSAGDQFLFGFLRERPQDAHGPRRLSARAWLSADFSRRARLGFLRALFSRGCAKRRLYRRCGGGCLPRD